MNPASICVLTIIEDVSEDGQAYKTLPWSPDHSPIEHVWDMVGRRLHLPGSVDDLARQWSKFGKKYRRRPSGCFMTLCLVV
ncbi:hypothetical protein TNCV_1867101 [Trichonephila clavipes]|nr:hypothetical protein TNCV_1867101 [Trichonephila clavipes]